MPNQYVNKVVTSNGTTLIDLTGDTVTSAAHIMQGYVGHLADGSQVTGTWQGGSGYTRTVICPEQTVVSTSPPEDDTDMLLLTSTDDLVEGDYYLVTVNGTERVQTAVRNNYVLYLADITDAWWGGNRMVIMASGDIYFCPWSAGTYTVKVEHLELDSSGGGESATLITKEITANGTYSAEDDDADGYSSVTVNVSSSAASSWTKIAEETYTFSTSSTGYTTVGTLQTGNTGIWTSGKILYVRIMDTNGKRTGHFYGSHNYSINLNPINNTTSATNITQIVRNCFSYTSGSKYSINNTSGTGGYGVFADTIYPNGDIRIRARYNSNYSLTINGTYKVEVYLLDPAGGVPIFT